LQFYRRSIIYRHIIFFVLRMTTATATELELFVMSPVAMDDDTAGEDNADLSAEAEPGDDELKEEGEEGEKTGDEDEAAE
jgi:hypothetical protein